jgi:photosystem II stability/assembly factor-like uncharacterized protein
MKAEPDIRIPWRAAARCCLCFILAIYDSAKGGSTLLQSKSFGIGGGYARGWLQNDGKNRNRALFAAQCKYPIAYNGGTVSVSREVLISSLKIMGVAMFIGRRCSLISMVIGLLSIAGAQLSIGAEEWQQCGAIEGGRILAQAIDPQNTQVVYAAAANGIFKSLDGGENWLSLYRWKTRASVFSLAINPENTQVLYAATTNEGVYRSTDGGTNWDTVSAGLAISYLRAFAMDPQSPDTLYAGTANRGIYKSMDGGENWNSINRGLADTHVQALAINPQDEDVLYAGTASRGVFRSSDGGGSWNPANNGLTVKNVIKLAIDPLHPEALYAGTDSGAVYPDYPIRVFKSTNGGENWSNSTTGMHAQALEALVVDPQNPSILYAAAQMGSMYKSSDGGQNWNSFTIQNLWVSSLAIDPVHTEIVYAATMGGGVFKSIDRTANWSAVNSGLTAAEIRAFAIDPKDEEILYAGTSSGIFRSSDGCMNWVAMNNGLASARNFYSLVVDPKTPQTIYAGAAEGYSNVSFKSIDGGENWSELSLPSAGVFAYAIDPKDPSIIYAGSDGNNPVYKSVNSGESWQNTSTGLGFAGLSVFTIAINPQTPEKLYVGSESSGLFKSSNSAGTFSYITSEPQEIRAISIDPQNPDTVYVASWDSGVFKTTNGLDFSAANNGLTSFNATSVAVHPRFPSFVYAGICGDGVFASSDGGSNWESISRGLTDGNIRTLAMSPTAPRRIYAGTSSGETWFYLLPSLSLITVTSNPAGRSFSVDGIVYSSAQTFIWEQGSRHTVSVPSLYQGSDATRYFFANWSDGGVRSHLITVPAGETTYTASFLAQYKLTTSVSPQGGGCINASPASPDGFYAAESSVRLTATAGSGHSFLKWSGSTTGTTNPITVTMSEPRSVTAIFKPVGATRPIRIRKGATQTTNAAGKSR